MFSPHVEESLMTFNNSNEHFLVVVVFIKFIRFSSYTIQYLILLMYCEFFTKFLHFNVNNCFNSNNLNVKKIQKSN